MSIGVFMKALNNIYFRLPIDFFFEFLPQIMLLWALFGWMDFLIIAKWITPINYDDDGNAVD
jgi:V-type H+-transporting ATPase subunit a